MTAHVNGNGNGFDIRGVLERADRRLARRNGDDPLPPTHIDAFASAVEAQLPALIESGKVVDFDEARLEQIRAELQRALDEQERLANELERAKAAADDKVDSWQEHGAALGDKVAQLTDQLDEARAERDTALAQLRDRSSDEDGAALADDLEARQREVEMLDRQQKATLHDLARMRGAWMSARRRAQNNMVLADQMASLWDEVSEAKLQAERAGHQHRWELNQETGELLPCPDPCGTPYPRYLVEDPDDDWQPEAEPLEALFARIRAEVGEPR